MNFSVSAAERMDTTWQKSVEQMGQSLSDALMNGGKSAAGTSVHPMPRRYWPVSQ